MIAAAYAGTGDQYWYVKPDSPLKTLADATENQTMSYSTNGATSHAIALAFGKQLGVKAKPIATGGPTATYTMTMTGQVDIGWGVMPFGLKEYQEGKFRIIARGSDVPSMRNQTMRVQVVNANALKERKDVMLRFMRAYRETLDWMYASPQAVKFYAEKMKMAEELVVLQRDQFNPKDAMLPDRLSDLDLVDGGRGRAEVPRQAADQGRAERAVPDSAGGVVSVRRQCRLLRWRADLDAQSSIAARRLRVFAAAHALLLAEFAHLALARDGRLRHQRRDAEFGERDGDLLHLVGAADAVARHAFEVVVDHLVPIERRIIVLQRRRDLVARCRRAARRGSIRRSAPRCP